MSVLPTAAAGGKESAAVLSIVFENYLKVVKLNVFTGSFRLIKTYRDHRDKGAETSGSFFEYAKRSVREGTVHRDDSGIFLRYLDSDYLAGRLSGGTGGKHIMLHGLRCRIFSEYKNVTMEIIASKDFSREHPWAIMGISCTDKLRSDIGAVLDKAYCKIVHVRLTDGYYEPVYMTDSEISAEESLAPGIVNWFAGFAVAGNVHEDDMEKFLRFMDMGHLRRLLEEREEAQLSYRRRINGEYRPVCMKIVRSPDYTHEDPWALTYIYEEDPEGIYLARRETSEKYFGHSDIMTGIRSRQCYEELCREYVNAGRKEPVGVLYAKLSADREDNDTARENQRIFALILMETFGRERTFRISENEFAAVSFGGNGESFRRRAAGFCSEYIRNVSRRAMTGFFRDEAAESITSVMEICKEYASGDVFLRDDDEY
ncbi:MAG: hypothetical protein ACI4J0_08865 [Huintestinicola sp.]|uniref:hypothetical protein n=1 Tax=Huintestinicola sp. TaxID=2981661 RepID=UPI003EFD799B